jgi:hypothetical protein
VLTWTHQKQSHQKSEVADCGGGGHTVSCLSCGSSSRCEYTSAPVVTSGAQHQHQQCQIPLPDFSCLRCQTQYRCVHLCLHAHTASPTAQSSLHEHAVNLLLPSVDDLQVRAVQYGSIASSDAAPTAYLRRQHTDASGAVQQPQLSQAGRQPRAAWHQPLVLVDPL